LFYETIEKELKTKSKKEYEATKKYFIEMQDCFYEMHRVLDDDGVACIVIGNTELKKVKILNAQIFVEIMLNIGFDIEKIAKRRIPSKNLPSTRDAKTGKFTSVKNADKLAYPSEYILIMRKR
jgi:DNA modification methylase